MELCWGGFRLLDSTKQGGLGVGWSKSSEVWDTLKHSDKVLLIFLLLVHNGREY